MSTEGNTPHRLRHRWVPWAVLGMCLTLTLAISLLTAWMVQQQEELRFRALAQDREAAIQKRLDVYVALLRATAGYFAGSKEVTREEFDTFARRLRLEENYPGMQGLGFSLRISDGELEAVRARLRGEGVTNVISWPTNARAEHHAIVYLHPPDARNAAAIGFDMFTEPTRARAMTQARDTAAPVASGKVTLVQEIYREKQAGFLLYVPVYRGGDIPPTVEQRRERLVGFAYAPFRAGDLLASITTNAAAHSVHLEVYDGLEVQPNALLHRSHVPPSKDAELYTEARVQVAAHPWTLVFRPTANFESTALRAAVPLVAGGGVLASLLIFSATLAQMRAQAAAHRSAAQLAAAQEQLRQHAADLERRVAERTASLRESLSSLESFSYSIAHDLRAPLRTIHSFADLLAHDHAPHLDSQAKNYLERMSAAAARMDHLIQDLLAYGRLTREELPIEHVALEEAVSGALESHRDDINARHATVEVRNPLPNVRANATLVQQVLHNLIDNAIKFVPSTVPPRVEIAAQQADGRVRVSVRDNGIGIDPAQHERIFRVFERLHSAEEFSGTGIGLAIVQKAMERMNGRVGVESKPGSGSTFWFELPAAGQGKQTKR